MGASLLLIELVFLLLGVFGVWLMSPPVAYVVAGILGIIAVERAQARRDEERLHAAVRAAAEKVLPKIGKKVS
jgi:phosphate/sulfate permease